MTSEKDICSKIEDFYKRYETHISTTTKGLIYGNSFLTQFKINGILTQIKCINGITSSIYIKQDNKLVHGNILNKSAELDRGVVKLIDIFGEQSTLTLPIPSENQNILVRKWN